MIIYLTYLCELNTVAVVVQLQMFWIHSHQTGVENAVTLWRQKSKLVLVSLLLTGLLLAALLVAGYYLKTHRKNSKGVRLVSPEQVKLLSLCLLAFALWNIKSQMSPKCIPTQFVLHTLSKGCSLAFLPSQINDIFKCLHMWLHPWGGLDGKGNWKLH